MLDINDPRIIQFLNESYTKETRLRIRWFRTNAHKLQQAAGEGRELRGIDAIDVLAAGVAPGVEALRVSHQESAPNRKTVPIRDTKEINGIESLKKTYDLKELGLASAPDARLDRPASDLSADPVMRPVSPADMHVFYRSKPDYGREQYLHRRTKPSPEEKYYFAECTSWEYGWRLTDSQLPALTRATRGRRCALAREAAASVGPQPDPAHYAPPATPPNFCSIIDQ